MKRVISFKKWLSESALPIEDPNAAGETFAEILVKNYPVKEIPKGKNHGKEVDRYVNTAGLNNNKPSKALPNTGYPWCMAFVYTMHNDLCKVLGIANTLPRTAGVLKHWDRSEDSVKISISDARRDPSLVKPGQVFIMTRPGNGTGHTGIVTSVDVDKKTFKTIEGNTNDARSGEGHRVGMHTRKLSQKSLVGFTDYFKGSRTQQFEEAISSAVANAPTDYSPERKSTGGTKGLLIAIGGKNYSGEKLKTHIPSEIQKTWEVVTFDADKSGSSAKAASKSEIIKVIENARKRGVGEIYLTGFSLGCLMVFEVANSCKVDKIGLIDPSIPKSYSISNFPTAEGSVVFMYGSPGMAKYYNDGRWETLSKLLENAKQVVERIEQGHFEFPSQFYKKYVKVGVLTNPSKSSNVISGDAFGSTTDEVKEIQLALVQKGYPLPKYGVDGKIGKETRGQIKAFQEDNSLPPTGIVDSATAEVLTGKTKTVSTSTKKMSSRYGAKSFEIWDREEKRVLYFKKIARKDIVRFKMYARGNRYLGTVLMDNNKIFLQDDSGNNTDISEKSFAVILKNYFSYHNVGSTYVDSDSKYIVQTGESSITHNYTGDASKNILLLEATAKKHGITNPNTIIGLLSVIGKETSFIPKNEYSYRNTGISRLRHLFKGPLKHLSDDEVLSLRKDDVAFYDVIYGHIAVQNGYHTWNNKSDDPVKPGDGYKYRGRGFNQVTFKQSYKKYAKQTGIDIVTNPDKLNDVNVAAEVAVLFLLNRLKQKNIDPNSFKTADEAVQMCARANAGWGKNASGAIASARKVEKRLDVKTNLA